MSEYNNLVLEYDNSVATVTLDSTANFNAITFEMTKELTNVAVTLDDDPGVRAVVLTHEGDSFCSGADLAAFDGDESDAPQLRELAGSLHQAIIRFHNAEVPIVGGVDGVAAGAGFSLAIFTDLLLLSEAARLEYAYLRVGLTGDGGTTFFLPRLVGLRRAKEILLLEEPIEADEAVELGLATETVPTAEFDDRLDELANQLAEGPTSAIGATKRLMTESFDTSLEAQLSAETEAIADATYTDDFERGHAAFFGDEDPEFIGQ